MPPRHLGAIVALALLVGCAQDSSGPSGVGRQLDIRVAPLSLPGVVDACYGLEVLNEALSPVWSQPSVCADQYGDLKSDITYIGTCDASDPNVDGVAEATVVLTIAGLYGPDTALDVDTAPDLLTDYRDPCAAPYSPGGCRIKTRCRENADVQVEFNLTVMREANQGFFDIAVNFEDIFCSAKVDCAYPATNTTPAQPIELVFDPATGKRVQTVVWALACTDGDPAGELAASTHLYMDDVVLVCGGVSYPVSASAGPGNVYPDGVGAPAPLVQAMVFEGRELIRNGAVDADKRYWNVALGLRDSFFHPATGTAPSCTLVTKATASRGPLTLGVTPTNTNYPYVAVSVPINVGNALVCKQHGLDGDGPNAGVGTAYTGPKPDGSGFATTSFGNVGAPTSDGLATNPIGVPVDECAATTPPCHANATCTDLTAGFTCVCRAGYSGNGFECTDSDGCAGAPCYDGVSCTDVVAPGEGFDCGECPTGMTGDGVACEEINGCLGEPCDPRAGCTDLISPLVGFQCGACPTGTEGNGETCDEVDGCEGSPCYEGVACEDVLSPGVGFDCGQCPSGLSGDGETCVEINGCAGDPCFEGVDCEDRLAPEVGYDCGECPAGMRGDGESCEEIDACDDFPCGALADCQDLVGGGNHADGRECLCDEGFELDGDDCVDSDECADVVSPCEYPSACANVQGDFECYCPEGTTDDGDGGCKSVLDGYSYIPAGTFTMGSPDTELGRASDETQHAVTLTRAFWMKQTEVTQAEWLAVMGNNPSYHLGDPQRPVEQVTWWDALAFVNALSTNAGLPSCYALTGCSGVPGSSYVCSDVSLSSGCTGYRLPTEAEWEYAARAGDVGSRYGLVDDIAWSSNNSGGSTHAVATALPNAWDIHDVLGNVWEWTWDRYGDFSGNATDPTGPATGATRAFRGGSLGDPADFIRYAERANTNPTHRGASHGIRVVRTILACGDTPATDYCLANGSVSRPARSCIALFETWPSASSGPHWIDVDGTGPGEAVLTWCDMTPGDAGWTLITSTKIPTSGDPTWSASASLPASPPPRATTTRPRRRTWGIPRGNGLPDFASLGDGALTHGC